MMFSSTLIDKMTVLMVTYNRFDLVHTAVMSMLAYSHYPIKLWILNNNPDPEYTQKLQELVSQVGAPPIRLWNMGENLRDTGAFNQAMPEVETEFVACVSDDIVFLPGSGRTFWENMLKAFWHPSVGAVGPGTNCTFATQNIDAWAFPFTLVVPQLHGFFIIFRTSVYREVNGYNVDLLRGPDIDISFRIRDLGYNLIAVRDSFVYHVGGATFRATLPGYPGFDALSSQKFFSIHGRGNDKQPFLVLPLDA